MLATFTHADWMDRWRFASFVVGLDAPSSDTPALSVEYFVSTLQQIVETPINHLEHSQLSTESFSNRVPDIAEENSYLMIALNAKTETSELLSSESGGILFEDPAWALIAAISLSSGTSRALPIANDNQDLWVGVSDALKQLHDKNFDYAKFLDPIDGFGRSEEDGPVFSFITVKGDKLSALRKAGIQSLPVAAPPLVYELFKPKGQGSTE